MSVNTKMTALAEAIRAKTGKTTPLTLDQMVDEIKGISGGTKLYAVIAVTYPLGSTVTCISGTTELPPVGTDGQCIFSVPFAGKWTVAAEDGENSDVVYLDITTEGQFEKVDLSYGLYLFKEGVGLCAAPDGTAFEPVFGATTWSVTEAGIVWSTKKDTGNAFYFKPKLNCSVYSKLNVELQSYEQAAAQYKTSIGVGVNETTGANQANGWTAVTHDIWSTTRAVFEVPLDNVTEITPMYVKIVSYANTGIVYNIWLEE